MAMSYNSFEQDLKNATEALFQGGNVLVKITKKEALRLWDSGEVTARIMTIKTPVADVVDSNGERVYDEGSTGFHHERTMILQEYAV